GKMIRAAASNPDAARLCGISIPKVSSITWGIAGALSAVTAVLLAPSQASFEAARLGPELLLLALGAAAAGGFVSVPAACIVGVGLIIVFALVGVGLTMLVGWAGQVSLGHVALVGVGAFITARLAPHGWSLPPLLVLSGLAGAATMAVTGLPALRLRGLTLAVTTLGFAVVAPIWLFRQSWFGSNTPFGRIVEPVAIAKGLGRPFDQIDVYYVGLVVLALVLIGGSLLRNSIPGRLVF